MATFINLTSHPLRMLDSAGVEHVLKPSGIIARVGSTQEKLPDVGGFSVSKTVWGEVTGLPPYQEGVFLIVSALVLARCQDRPDVLGPDTGSSALRSRQGHVVAIRGFVK